MSKKIKLIWSVVTLVVGLIFGGGAGFYFTQNYYGDYEQIRGDKVELENKLEICNNSNSAVAVGDGATAQQENNSTIYNIDGPLTTNGSLNVGSGGSVNVGSADCERHDKGIRHLNNTIYANVLVKTNFGEAFINYFAPNTWYYFAACDKEKNCNIFKGLEYNNQKVCNRIIFDDINNIEKFSIESLNCK